MNINPLILAKSKNSAKLMIGFLLIGFGLIQGYPNTIKGIQEKELANNLTKQKNAIEAAKLEALDQQVEDGKLLAKQAELAKTRIFSGAAHLVMGETTNGAAVQLKVGKKYYGRGDVRNPIPLPPGTVVRDLFCGTGVIAQDFTLQNYASAQGECVQIINQLRQAQNQPLNGDQNQ